MMGHTYPQNFSILLVQFLGLCLQAPSGEPSLVLTPFVNSCCRGGFASLESLPCDLPLHFSDAPRCRVANASADRASQLAQVYLALDTSNLIEPRYRDTSLVTKLSSPQLTVIKPSHSNAPFSGLGGTEMMGHTYPQNFPILLVQAPANDEWQEISIIFSKPRNFPNGLGAVDGKHVQIMAPPNSGSNYFKYKFCRNIRVSRTVAMLLTDGFEASPVNPLSDNGGSPAKTAEEHVLTFLWYAANKTCLRDVAGRLGLDEATAFRIIECMIEYLREVAKTVISFPADLEQLAKHFEQVSGVPGTIGCIDGSYISIRCPANKIRSTYINRHMSISLTAQACCDNNKKFVE
ncbi:uncharacterized protein LOC144105445 [Amblyomma americanum]